MINIVRVAFVALLLLLSLAFVYLGAKTLKVRGAWSATVAKLEGKDGNGGQIGAIEQQNDLLANGDATTQVTPLWPGEGRPVTAQLKEEKPGVRQLEVALDALLVDRGRVWDQCKRGQVDAEKGEASVKIDAPTPHSIRDGTLLYVFQKAELDNPDAPTRGTYLGPFKVTGVNGQTIVLSPAERLSPRKLEQIVNSQSDWVLYEVMPSDRHSAFAGLGEAELAKLIPQVSRPGYLADGKDAQADTPPEQISQVWVRNAENKGKFDLVPKKNDTTGADEFAFEPNATGAGEYDLREGKYVGGKFVSGRFYLRPLRDYAVALRELHRDIWEMEDSVLAMNTQLAAMKRAADGLVGEGGQVASRDREIVALNEELQRVTAERDLVQKQSAATVSQLASLEEKINRLLAENKQLAERWTAEQTEAARRVDALTGPVRAGR
ncbi:MAG TPA: hypothetical protein VHZ24_12425 [Pirellulales bacterium]|jgi:hypothetical protein|nr:hypothetical protein [Pirellulales bacterium]